MKKVLITQSNYIPWKGFFDALRQADEFIAYDDAQYTKRDWRNRNRIKTTNGPIWLSIPVKVKGKFNQKINETVISDNQWKHKHWKSLEYNYRKSTYFSEYGPLIKHFYDSAPSSNLSETNYHFTKSICELLKIETQFSFSSEYELVQGKNERLLEICKQANADVYLSGPSAKNYLDEDMFAKSNIRIEYLDYGSYPEYPQLFPPFIHEVSILDLIFNTGPDALKYMKPK